MEKIIQHNEENHKFYYYRLCQNSSDLALRLENLERDKVTSNQLMQEKIENQEKIIKSLQEKLSEVMDRSKKEKEFFNLKINKLEQMGELKLSYDIDEPEKDGSYTRSRRPVKSNNDAEIEKMVESKLKSQNGYYESN